MQNKFYNLDMCRGQNRDKGGGAELSRGWTDRILKHKEKLFYVTLLANMKMTCTLQTLRDSELY